MHGKVERCLPNLKNLILSPPEPHSTNTTDPSNTVRPKILRQQ